MKSLLVIVVLLPALVTAKKCTNPTGGTAGTTQPATTQRPTDPQEETTTFPPIETTTEIIEETTTPYLDPPRSWPGGKWGLLQAGKSCPGFFKFKRGIRYQDTEDYLNGNQWTQEAGFPGKMKRDGYTFHYCSKHKSQTSYGAWPAGDYCIHRVGSKCPKSFKVGTVKWDDENSFNSNSKNGYLPAGLYNQDTVQHFCCRNDSSSNAAIELPITKPFYLYRFTSSCQRVRGMRVTEEVIQFDDEDDDNKDYTKGAHPFDSGNNENHRLHYCHYQRK